MTSPSPTHSISKDEEAVKVEYEVESDPDAEFGGTEARKALEKKLLFKLDMRMSILIAIYILNYVRLVRLFPADDFRLSWTIVWQIDRNNAA